MAKKLLPAPALPAVKPKKKSTLETSSYWAALNETVFAEEAEPMPQQEVHGIRRAAIRKRIL